MAKRRTKSKARTTARRRHINLYALQSRPWIPGGGSRNKRIMFETRERAEWYIHRRDLDPSKWEILHYDEGGTLRAYTEAAHNERFAGR